MAVGVNSKEIQEQSNLLFSSILEEQRKFQGIKPSDPEKKQILEEKMKEYESLRGRGFFFNQSLSSGRGHGPFTEMIDGSIKYDLINGIGFNLLGHSHPLYIKSHLEAATADVVMCGNLQTHQEPYELSQILLAQVKNSKLKHFWFSCSGSYANDTALKLIWQKKAPKYKVFAFKNAFAGRSVATQDLTYNASYREGMPQAIEVTHVPHYDQNDPENSSKKTIAALEKAWQESPNQYCALMTELLQGEAGFVYGPKQYYMDIFEWAKAKDLFVWVDEIQTFARTKKMFCFQMLELEKYVDLVTVAKALQACGILFSAELNPKPGLIAGTFNGSLAALNMGRNIVKYLSEGNFYGDHGRIAQLEHKFFSKFELLKNGSCKGKLNYFGGIGTMLSFEVGNASKEITDKFLKQLFENGIVAFSGGKDPCRVRFLLPLCLSDEHIEEIFKILETTILQSV